MKYIATINGKKYDVEIERVSSGLRNIGHASENSCRQENTLQSVASSPNISDAKPKTEEVKEKSDRSSIESPMPGTVLNVLVNVGDYVSDGKVVAILEAMKMEIEVTAGSAGTVSEIYVKRGDKVESGTKLMSLQL